MSLSSLRSGLSWFPLWAWALVMMQPDLHDSPSLSLSLSPLLPVCVLITATASSDTEWNTDFVLLLPLLMLMSALLFDLDVCSTQTFVEEVEVRLCEALLLLLVVVTERTRNHPACLLKRCIISKPNTSSHVSSLAFSCLRGKTQSRRKHKPDCWTSSSSVIQSVIQVMESPSSCNLLLVRCIESGPFDRYQLVFKDSQNLLELSCSHVYLCRWGVVTGPGLTGRILPQVCLLCKQQAAPPSVIPPSITRARLRSSAWRGSSMWKTFSVWSLYQRCHAELWSFPRLHRCLLYKWGSWTSSPCSGGPLLLLLLHVPPKYFILIYISERR